MFVLVTEGIRGRGLKRCLGCKYLERGSSLRRPPQSREQAPPASCGHTPAGRAWLRPRGPPPVLRPGQWRSYEWHDLPKLGSRQPHWAWTAGKTLLEGEAGRGCCTPANLPLSLELPNHSAANWLRDVAGCRFPGGLCGTLLPGD
ncbi:hypothetical protein FD755_022546 [Muntiacus reevesi]|uniref:Uncharacterized protein n=1 Tax=Muntiacus reevesi TaxID=9886 RepID=A0A5N3W0A2_MUNRE|nr:hypothetical protein FD755_022546 [Muntiacus reevesi]